MVIWAREVRADRDMVKVGVVDKFQGGNYGGNLRTVHAEDHKQDLQEEDRR